FHGHDKNGRRELSEAELLPDLWLSLWLWLKEAKPLPCGLKETKPLPFGLCKKNILTSGNFTGIISTKQFLQQGRIDKKGYLLDPFMNRYGYSADKGRVYSITRGYEKW
ncbi:MAG: hypothetical protein QMD94_03835, partial [Candidatus Omnitrophota bacterium]|nr:hypothetical protein [Candidatus Omnitrophota bacterium]